MAPGPGFKRLPARRTARPCDQGLIALSAACPAFSMGPGGLTVFFRSLAALSTLSPALRRGPSPPRIRAQGDRTAEHTGQARDPLGHSGLHVASFHGGKLRGHSRHSERIRPHGPIITDNGNAANPAIERRSRMPRDGPVPLRQAKACAMSVYQRPEFRGSSLAWRHPRPQFPTSGGLIRWGRDMLGPRRGRLPRACGSGPRPAVGPRRSPVPVRPLRSGGMRTAGDEEVRCRDGRSWSGIARSCRRPDPPLRQARDPDRGPVAGFIAPAGIGRAAASKAARFRRARSFVGSKRIERSNDCLTISAGYPSPDCEIASHSASSLLIASDPPSPEPARRGSGTARTVRRAGMVSQEEVRPDQGRSGLDRRFKILDRAGLSP